MPDGLALYARVSNDEKLVVRILKTSVQEPAEQHGVQGPAAGREERGHAAGQVGVALAEVGVEHSGQSSAPRLPNLANDLGEELQSGARLPGPDPELEQPDIALLHRI